MRRLHIYHYTNRAPGRAPARGAAKLGHENVTQNRCIPLRVRPRKWPPPMPGGGARCRRRVCAVAILEGSIRPSCRNDSFHETSWPLASRQRDRKPGSSCSRRHPTFGGCTAGVWRSPSGRYPRSSISRQQELHASDSLRSLRINDWARTPSTRITSRH